MSRKFTIKLTKQELATKIADMVVKDEDYDPDDTDCWGKPRETFHGDDLKFLVSAKYGVSSFISCLPEKIQKDLSKVEFDMENIEWVPGEAYVGADDLVGIRTLPNGLTYMGVTAGGDWEMPIFFILYFDGKEIRGYIPKEGNTWNFKTKSAFGNSDGEIDDKHFKIQTGKDGYWGDNNFSIDKNLIEIDIQSRIEYAAK